MESISSKKIIYQYGLLTGLVGLVWGIVQFIMGTHYENDTVSQIVGSIILIVGIVLGQLAFRKENNGIVAYSQCLKIGVGISLIQAIIGLIYYYSLTNLSVINLHKNQRLYSVSLAYYGLLMCMVLGFSLVLI